MNDQLKRPAEHRASDREDTYDQSQLKWFMAGVAGRSAAGGIHMVLIPWIVLRVLDQSAGEVGFIQSAGSIPPMLLLLIGGGIADRMDARLLLVRSSIIMIALIMCLTVISGFNVLTYTVLVCYALLTGCMNAMIQPARDALLSRISGPDIQRAVAMLTGFQIGIMVFGAFIAGFADAAGLTNVLVIQTVIFILSLYTVVRLKPAPPIQGEHNGSRKQKKLYSDIAAGIRQVRGSERIFPIVLLNFLSGLVMTGIFLVSIPVMIKQVFQGGSAEISYGMMAFTGGTISGVLILLKAGTVRRPGRLQMMMMFLAAGLLSCASFASALWMFLFFIFLWGMSAGVSHTMGRGIVQESADPEHRARVLSVFALSIAGAMPVGTLFIGYLADLFGPALTILLGPAAMMISLCILMVKTNMWHWVSESGGAKEQFNRRGRKGSQRIKRSGKFP